MFTGYLEWSGTELLNRQRTEAYVAHLAPQLLKPIGGAETLHIITGDESYRTPILDSAPWANRFDPATDQFFGLYPLDVQGIGDSTYSASSTESLEDGGTTQGGRSSTRDVKVSGLLVGSSELGAEAGLTWLRAALAASSCADQCGGYLRYFLAEPRVCEVAWGEEDGTNERAVFGAVSAGQRVVYRWTRIEVDPTMPARAIWSTSAIEGVQVEYGALDTAGQKLWSSVVTPLRVNYATNPTFRSSADGLTGAVTWVFSGGTDGGGYAQLGIDGVSSDSASTSWASPLGDVTTSFALRSDTGSLIAARLVNAATGTVVDSQEWVGTGDWQRVSLSGPTHGTILQFTSSGLFGLDDVLCEVGDTALPYFDGTQDDADHAASWQGAPDASPSTLSFTGRMELVGSDSDFRPYFATLSGTAQQVRLTWYYRTPIDVSTQLAPIDRSLHNVAVTQAPQIVQRIDGTETGNGYFIQVEFLFNAGNPFSYSPGVPVTTTPLFSAGYKDPTTPAELDDDWLFDPAALVPSAPPAAPDILADAIDASITSWQRYYISIPAEDVADWAASVPVLQINTHSAAVRQIRVRFHANPFAYNPQDVDPLTFCADFLISYLPATTTLLLNGITQTALASKAGVASVPADSILYGSTGGPMTWPHLSCGIGYVMTIDVPSSSDYDLFDVELQMLREE